MLQIHYFWIFYIIFGALLPDLKILFWRDAVSGLRNPDLKTEIPRQAARVLQYLMQSFSRHVLQSHRQRTVWLSRPPSLVARHEREQPAQRCWRDNQPAAAVRSKPLGTTLLMPKPSTISFSFISIMQTITLRRAQTRTCLWCFRAYFDFLFYSLHPYTY